MNPSSAVLTLLLSGLILAAGCGRSASVRTVKLTGDPSAVIGHLKWAITQTDTGQVIGQGERDILLSEATAKTVTSEVGDLTHLKVPLSDHFLFGIATTKKDETGFGITAERDDEQTFCWDWFNVSGQTGTKLQETGQMALQFNSGQIQRADFETDVSLRVSPMDAASDPLNPKWRVLISKGSYITIPR